MLRSTVCHACVWYVLLRKQLETIKFEGFILFFLKTIVEATARRNIYQRTTGTWVNALNKDLK